MRRDGESRLFGTDGIRGRANEYPLDELTVARIGEALAARLKRDLGRPPALVIGRDTRESGPLIERALALGAYKIGSHLESAGVITTPGVAYLARTFPFDAGVVISASHNPYHDNGIKVFSRSGEKLPDEMERTIEEGIGSTTIRESDLAKMSDVRSSSSYVESYIDYLVAGVARGMRLDGVRLALDCANGSASAIAPEVFRRLGAEITVLAAEPNGRNINDGCGSLYPEALCELVKTRGLEAGVAFDGDADRALFVDEHGAMVDGDAVMLILAEHFESCGLLQGRTVVGTVMSNLGLEIALRERGIDLIRTQVGDRYVLEQLLARGASIGGEQSGHIIFPSISLAGDGIITAIELLRVVKEQSRTLSDLASRLRRLPQVLVNVRVRSKPPLEGLPEVQAAIRQVERELGGRGRILVRYSGTENLARVMIEGEDQSTIERQAGRLVELLKNAIG